MKPLRAISAAVVAWSLPALVWAQQQDRSFANPLTGKAEGLGLASIIGQIVRAILGASGVVAALVIIVAGLRIIFSQGNEDTIAQGKRALLWAVIGLVVAFGGYMIVDVVLTAAEGFLS